MKTRQDLFGDSPVKVSQLELWFYTHNDGSLFTLKQNGPRKKTLILPEGITLELRIVTPETWGVLFTIITGPADFSHWLVTSKRQGGALPSHLQIKDGLLWCAGKIVPTPEEHDLFREIGLPYIDPQKREAQWRR